MSKFQKEMSMLKNGNMTTKHFTVFKETSRIFNYCLKIRRRLI